MDAKEFAAMPWLNQIELAHRVTKTAIETLVSRLDDDPISQRVVGNLIHLFAREIIDQIGAPRILEAIQTAAAQEIRHYLYTYGMPRDV